MMRDLFKDDNVVRNYGNNGIYGRFSNTVKAFGFLATLYSPFATLRSGRITRGYGATGVALPPTQIPLRGTSDTLETLSAIGLLKR